jgi:hypothetical protein
MYSGSVNYAGAPVPLGNSPQSVQCYASSTGYQYTYTDSFQAGSSFGADWTVNGTASIYSPGAAFPQAIPYNRLAA